MLNDPNKESENDPIEVRCYFVRQRNALLVRSDFGTIYRDYYLHLMQHEIKYGEKLDAVLKDALAGLTLHLASRPRIESHAWTMSWQDPRYNLFVTGSNQLGNITGRIFTEDVKKRDSNLFFSQVSAEGEPGRQSTIEIQTDNFFSIVEEYYDQSEQRPARLFRYDEEDFVMVTAQPDCDLEWFHGLSDESIRELDKTEEMSLLETRFYVFDCGCSLFKLLPVIGGLSEEARNDLFGPEGEPALITCPRCGARYVMTREMLNLYLEKPQ
ncbi:MAG: Hsp33 family molecular chaperone HslO [Verrucomicrobiales bacterium]|nr:Hsp33 family molecular chaperone HslO [Verrucomicrobiales bacterium]